jgi:hypothetical protein
LPVRALKLELSRPNYGFYGTLQSHPFGASEFVLGTLCKMMQLPPPIGRQKEVLYLPAEGHVAVLGTAGSGKTTLAILRALYLADVRTQHGGPTLLVTFNKALVTYLRHLIDRNATNVVIEHYHLFARGYLRSRKQLKYNSICSNPEKLKFIEQAIAKLTTSDNRVVLHLGTSGISEEIRLTYQLGLTSFEDYQQCPFRAQEGLLAEPEALVLLWQNAHL